MKKIVIVSSLLASLSLTALIATAVSGSGYAISVTGIATSSYAISLSGSVSADPYKGNDDQQIVRVRDWGDGSPEEAATTSLTFGAGKTFTGTWDANHTYADAGNYSITIEVCHQNCNGNDEGVDFSSVTITPFVGPAVPVNTDPVADTQSVTTNEDQAVAVTLSGSDADSDSLTYSTTTNPINGTLSGTGQNLTYTPSANFNGSDSFSFKTNDGTADSAPAVVSITVTPVNDAPVLALVGDKNADELAELSFQLSATDADADTLTYSLTTPLSGVSLTTDGLFSWTPTESQGPGTYFLTVMVSDGTLTDSEEFSIMVSELPDAVLESIAITTPATKLTYTVGDTLDISGLVITGTYDDASTSTLAITESNITGFDSSTPAAGQVLTVTYGGKTTTYTIDIEAAPVIPEQITTYTLIYTAGANGTISGSSTQIVNSGTDGSAVTAVPNSGFHFVNWSIGASTSTANPRTDTNVTGDMTVVANFEADEPAPVIVQQTGGSGGTGGAGGPNGIPGCRDRSALNYDSTALYDGPCTYATSSQVLGAATTSSPRIGEVLGAASSSLPLSCSEYLTLQKGVTRKALRENAKNSPELTVLLQRFLNEYVGPSLPVTGFFGPLTTSAVKKLQMAHKTAILAPWKLTKPTGIVYVTTVAHINNTKCPELNIRVTEAELIPAVD